MLLVSPILYIYIYIYTHIFYSISLFISSLTFPANSKINGSRINPSARISIYLQHESIFYDCANSLEKYISNREKLSEKFLRERKEKSSKTLRSNGVSLNRRPSVATDDWDRVVWHRARGGTRNSIDEGEEDRIQFVSLRANQFPWAVVRGIFNKKLDISCGFPFAFLFLLPLFRRERKATERREFASRICAVFVYLSLRYHPLPPEPAKQPLVHHPRINNVSPLSFFPFHSLRGSAHLTPMADHLLPRFIFSHLRALMKTRVLIDRVSRSSCSLIMGRGAIPLILLAIFHDCSNNNNELPRRIDGVQLLLYTETKKIAPRKSIKSVG